MRFKFTVVVEAENETEAWARYIHKVLLEPAAAIMADKSPAEVFMAFRRAGVCKEVTEYGEKKVESILGEDWIRTSAILGWINEKRTEKNWGEPEGYGKGVEDCMDELEWLVDF